VYVASGDAHKNHRRLLDAWVLLAEDGLFPSLVLTVGSVDFGIIERLDALRAAHGIRVDNLPDLDAGRVLALYPRARALIFPSTAESFGLPLLEAAAAGLPILAAERDYVRDVVTPVETFDPQSPVSIARAVRRFLGCAEAPVRPMTPTEFLERVLHP
jgi:glycosyltransferase involved in cell wall biosynthesis